MKRAGALTVAVALALMGLASGCNSDPTKGYAFASPYGLDVQTVTVPMFDNESYDTGLEPLFTEALVKEIQRTTPWRVVPQTGDTTLQASIQRAEFERLSRATGTGLTQEALRELTVDFVWRDNRTGEVLASRRGMRIAAGFVPQLGVGESADVGEWNAAEEMARAIVQELRSTW